MPYSFLTLSIDSRGVAQVTLNRPDVHNAFDDKLIAEIAGVFTELDIDKQVRVAVLSGNGKSFCAGGDLNWMKAMMNYNHAENHADAMRLAQMFERVRRFGKPLIGMVHGVALGGGSGLAAACDFVIAAEDARFGFTETRLGLIPATIAPYVIEKIGAGNARAYFTSGMIFPAATAKDIGLVQRVVPLESLASACEEIVAEFLRAGPQACRKAKTLIDRVTCLPKEKVADYTAQAIADIRVSKEAQEGMNALLAGCTPPWIEP